MTTAESPCKCLLLYTSVDGHTRCIMEFISKILEENGSSCSIFNLDDVHDHDLSKYNKVMIGTPVRYDRISKHVINFITKNSDILNSMPSALFIVNLTARKENKNTPQTNLYARKLIRAIPWVPTLSAVFAGALYYPRYTFYDRWLVYLIMHLSGGETDMSKEVVYTNWDTVKLFANNFNSLALSLPKAVKVYSSEKIDDNVARSKKFCVTIVLSVVSTFMLGLYIRQRKLKKN